MAEDRTLTTQKGSLVGDENQPEPREPEVDEVEEAVDAQVASRDLDVADQVNVHEVVVATDEVITDPSSPEAVQIPDAGRGSLELPAHRLQADRPEDVFSSEGSKSSKPKAKEESPSQ